jgi:hypothetical protein
MEELLKGLLSPAQMEQTESNARIQGLMALGNALMQAGAPRGQRTSTFQGLGMAAPAYMQGRQQAFDQTLQDILRQTQVQDLLRQRQEQEMARQRQSQVQSAMQLPMDQRIPALQNLGAYDLIKNMAESQTAVRRSGLLRQPGMEMENPFQPFTLASSPGVKQLAEQYTKSFEQGVLTEEQANQRILDLQRMEDAFISRTESAQERKDREERDRLDRQERDRLAKLERQQRDFIARQEREERQSSAAQERETKRLEGTEGQKLSAGFADRMVRSQNILNTLEGAGVGLPTTTTSIAGGVPFVGGYLERQVADTNQQRYKQAAMNWIRANLRKESGAAIGVDEMEKEYETYFPLPGDDPDTIKAKKDARDATTRAMILNAGPVFKMPELPPVTISGAQPKVRRIN